LKINPDNIYLFTKSGNQVRSIAPAGPYLGKEMWEVERIDGVSKGKRMDVPSQALVSIFEDDELGGHNGSQF